VNDYLRWAERQRRLRLIRAAIAWALLIAIGALILVGALEVLGYLLDALDAA
jgi:hypothetical protein